MGCGCRGSIDHFYVVDGSGVCAVPDGVGGCRKFRSPTLADAEAQRRGLTEYGIQKGSYK